MPFPYIVTAVPDGAVALVARLTAKRNGFSVIKDRAISTINAPAPIPPAPDVADWSIGANYPDPRFDQMTQIRENHSVVIAMAGITAVRWSNVAVPNPDNTGQKCLPVDGVANTYRLWWNSDTTETNAVPPGDQITNITIRVTRSALGLDAPVEDWSPWSIDRKDGLVVEQPPGTDPGDPTPPTDPGDPPPPLDLTPAATTLQSSVDLGNGVVVTFNKAVPVGEYWGGYKFVLSTGTGGFQITSVTPNSVRRPSSSNASISTAWAHGLMRDPVSTRISFRDRALQGWDESGEGTTNGNWMGRHQRYDHTLNVNPNLKGNISIADGGEAVFVKAVSDTSSAPNARRSIVNYIKHLYVVKTRPFEGDFPPTEDGRVFPKISLGNVAQLANVTHPIVTLTSLPKFSISQTKTYLEGPFLSCSKGARPYSAIYGKEQTFPKNDPLYSAVFSQAVNAAHCYILDSRTSSADRLYLMAKMCEHGARLTQAGTDDAFEYSPSHSFAGFVSMIDFAATALDNPIMRQAYSRTVGNDWYHEKLLKQGSTWFVNGGEPGNPPAGVAPKTSIEFIDSSYIWISQNNNWFRTPPEGTQSDTSIDDPIQTPFEAEQEWANGPPFSGGHIGFPFRTGSGSPNGGVHSNPNMSYSRLGWTNAVTDYFVCCYKSPSRRGVDVMGYVNIAVNDRYARFMEGHYDGRWSLKDGTEFSGSTWTEWEESWLDAYNKTRATVAVDAPIWYGRPEQPMPPLLTKPAAGQLRMNLLSFRCSNSGPLTGAQYKLRRVKSSNVSGSWANNAELRNLIFYNTAPWNAPEEMSPTTNALTLSGLASGIWQVKWRLRNSLGWGPWSTNCAYAGDERATAGWPAGPRGVILL